MGKNKRRTIKKLTTIIPDWDNPGSYMKHEYPEPGYDCIIEFRATNIGQGWTLEGFQHNTETGETAELGKFVKDFDTKG